MRGGARWALGLGAVLVAMATVSACADVVAIELDECSTSCVSPATDEPASAGGITLSLFGGRGAGDPSGRRPDLIFDSQTLPSVLVDGPPSPIVSMAAQALDGPGVSPYAFFDTIIDVPLFADARAFTAVPFFLFTPSVTSQLGDFLWASNDFFGRPSGDIASRRGLPLSADADSLTGRLAAGWRVRMPVMPTLSPSPLSGSTSSGAAGLFGQVGDGAGRSAEFSSDGIGLDK